MLSLNVFPKNLLNIFHANCSQIVPSFEMPSRLIGAPTVLSEMRLVRNFVFGKLYLISKKERPQIAQRDFYFILLQKKILPTIFG